MITMERLNEIICGDNDKRKIIIEVLSFLEKQRISFFNDKIFYVDERINDNYHFSSSIVEINKDSIASSYLNDYILDSLDKQQAIHLIIDSLNHICLKEDKEVFIERFVFKKRISTIKQKHCLSNNGYYQCLDRAINDCYSFLIGRLEGK